MNNQRNAMVNIIGRKTEIEELTTLYHSKKAEFVAVYGRRRVGKTHLTKELFRDKMTFFNNHPTIQHIIYYREIVTGLH